MRGKKLLEFLMASVKSVQDLLGFHMMKVIGMETIKLVKMHPKCSRNL